MGAPPATGGVTVDPKKLAEIETARCAAAPQGRRIERFGCRIAGMR
jgi:hypothetical protein